MATLEQLRAQIAEVESEISRLTERELQYQRFVIEVGQEILRATSVQDRERVNELNQESVERREQLAETRAQIDSAIVELNDLRRQLRVALNNPSQEVSATNAPESERIQTEPPEQFDLNQAERDLPTDFRIETTEFQKNDPQGYAEYIKFEEELVADTQRRLQEAADDAGIALDPNLVAINTQKARRAAVARFRSRMEDAGVITFGPTAKTAPEPVDTRTSAAQAADPGGVGIADDPEAQIFAEIVQGPSPQPVNVVELPTVVVEAELPEDTLPGLIENAQIQPNILEPRGDSCFNNDWRVRLSLAQESNYLYNASPAGILSPLKFTNGVIFPYMPQVSTSYTATYSNFDLTHSNYRGYFYQGSQVQEVRIQGIFTAQSTAEANYLLAVIHFFKSVTKMFYGQDDEFRGAPPPLLFLDAFGQYQFNQAPCVVAGFEYTLPNDVDYVKARITDQAVGVLPDVASASMRRLYNSNLSPGGFTGEPVVPSIGIETICPTYVPTKMEISVSLLPVQSRGQVSRQFSLKDYASGKLVKRGYW